MIVTAQLTPDLSSSLVFLRRQQVADMIVELSFNEAARERLPQLKGLLIDSLHQLPESCFIADDWTQILSQVVQALLNPDNTSSRPLPAHLQCAIGQLQQRLQ
ncbi:hypothetical protein [Saccharospirillum mangrovi]|uniref:hypothetical protein n=1 Tax=Saccharospirillum mangrovi TaxID=2161747 RepID=UPI000D38DB57|nr:hypothetical protein [Saccharospirillum mangrovi]